MLRVQASSCCAGLRPTLTQGWRQGLPLAPSPFRHMAAHSGSTQQELLRACAELVARGALQPIHAHWGPALGTERWRLFFEQDDAALVAALTALPGCLRLERCADDAGPGWLWAELETLDETALTAQVTGLPTAPAARLRVPPEAPVSAANDAADGPRADLALAARLEAGLPLCAHPFADCARQLGRSERCVLGRLLRWQQRGELHGLVLTPPPARQPRPGWIALWRQPPGALDTHGADLVRDCPTPSRHGWPWALTLVTAGLTPPPGLAGAQCLRVQVLEPREQALFFQAPA